MQIDFIIGDAYFNLKEAWQDHCIPIGNDHRCVHCILSRTEPYKQQYPRKHLLKGWKPFLDESGQPTVFHFFVQTLLAKKVGGQDMHTFDTAEFFLMSTAVGTGTYARQKFRSTPSHRLRLLRQRNKQVHDNAIRKSLTFQIRRYTERNVGRWGYLCSGNI